MISAYIRLIRLHRIAGLFPLLWPCLISLSIASAGNPDLLLSLVFILGSFFMRSAGCIINDIVDYDVDRHVVRTRFRPLANGELSFKQAVKFLGILLLLSASLLFFLNKTTILICLFSLVLVTIYPFCKRFTYWPQFVLGLAFNIGFLAGWAAVKGKIEFPAILLYIGGVFWTMGYDTIYAYQDRDDDLKLGLKSTAIKFGDNAKKYLNNFYTITSIMFVFAGNIAKIGLKYNLFMILPIALLFWQAQTLNINNARNCSIRFQSNVIVGGLVFLATILAGRM